MIEATPWITNNSLEWLRDFLKDDMAIFEYGSGGSTLFFAKHAKNVVSIEHDPRWHRKILPELDKHSTKNVEYFLHIPNKITKTSKYVNSISAYPDNSFDLVFVDGLDRNDCCRSALNKIKRGGYLMLDDSNRKQYSEALELLNPYKRTDFKGKKSHDFLPGMTSIWKIL